VQGRRLADMPGQLLVTLLCPAASSHAVSRHLCFVERVEEPTYGPH
jgi:hypothetical protein